MGTSRSVATPASTGLDEGLWCRAERVLSRHTPTRLLLLPAGGGEPTLHSVPR